MKIAFVINVDFALYHFLLPLMRGARQRGHDVLGICADGPFLERVRGEGFRVVTVPMSRNFAPRAQWRALRALVGVLRREKPDLVHGNMPISGFLARVAAKWVGTRVVAYTSHGFLFNQPGSLARRGLSLALEWLGGRLTDTYMTVSAEEAADARRLGIARRAVPVGNGRDPALFRPDLAARARIRTELGVAPETVVVCVVSRLVHHKGHAELAAAMRDVPGAELWVVGNRLPSDRGADMEAMYDASGLGPRLRRLGYRDDIPAVLAAADIFALPSHFEGLPMSVIEAMLVGLPVVATDIRGPREQVLTGVNGLLVPPRDAASLANALRRLVEDPALRASMGRVGRERAVALFDEAAVVARTLDVLEGRRGTATSRLRQV